MEAKPSSLPHRRLSIIASSANLSRGGLPAQSFSVSSGCVDARKRHEGEGRLARYRYCCECLPNGWRKSPSPSPYLSQQPTSGVAPTKKVGLSNQKPRLESESKVAGAKSHISRRIDAHHLPKRTRRGTAHVWGMMDEAST